MIIHVRTGVLGGPLGQTRERGKGVVEGKKCNDLSHYYQEGSGEGENERCPGATQPITSDRLFLVEKKKKHSHECTSPPTHKRTCIKHGGNVVNYCRGWVGRQAGRQRGEYRGMGEKSDG